MGVTPNAGTPGSTLVTATVPGVGPQTTGVDLIDNTGRSICREDAYVPRYGEIQCWSRVEYYIDAFQVRAQVGETIAECAVEDTSVCQFSQNNEDNSFPRIVSLSKTDTTLVFTGTGFYTVGYDVTAYYKEIEATSVVVDSETQVTATFEGGVPIWT